MKFTTFDFSPTLDSYNNTLENIKKGCLLGSVTVSELDFGVVVAEHPYIVL